MQITTAEDFGIDDRGAFYDAVEALRDVVAALRDVVQNHPLQVLALVTMKPPGGARSRPAARQQGRRCPPRSPPPTQARYVRGQYDRYPDVPGIAVGSVTETFASLRLGIDNDRWAGVPTFLRAGKALAQRVTDVRLLLHRAPPLAFLPNPTRDDANQIVLRIDTDQGLRLQIPRIPGPTRDNEPHVAVSGARLPGGSRTCRADRAQRASCLSVPSARQLPG